MNDHIQQMGPSEPEKPILPGPAWFVLGVASGMIFTAMILDLWERLP